MVSELFHRFARGCSEASGSPWAFTLAILVVVLWAASGPFFGYSDTWQLTINTVASIVPTLMVFLIQNTQNRDSRAVHLKLDELLADAEGARSPFINLQNLSQHDIDRLADRLLERIRRADRDGSAMA
ncbi:low affinity iron permease family protein [Sphingomonas oryzagri]